MKKPVCARDAGDERASVGVRDDRIWTVAELAEYLQVPEATLYQWRHKGTGPRSLRVGRHLRFRARDVQRWLDERVVGEPEQ